MNRLMDLLMTWHRGDASAGRAGSAAAARTPDLSALPCARVVADISYTVCDSIRQRPFRMPQELA